MSHSLEVKWTKESLENALLIDNYLLSTFGQKEVQKFRELLRNFENNVLNFPQLYPQSQLQPELRRAVLHKYLSVYCIFKGSRVTVIAISDNRQDQQVL